METEERIIVETSTVCCDGGDGPLGHPAVYLNFGAKTELVCPYCSRHFVRSGKAQPAGQH